MIGRHERIAAVAVLARQALRPLKRAHMVRIRDAEARRATPLGEDHGDDVLAHPNYLGPITPADRDLIPPSLMDQPTLVGIRDDLLARTATLQDAGVGEIVIQPVVDPPAEMAELAQLTIARRRPSDGELASLTDRLLITRPGAIHHVEDHRNGKDVHLGRGVGLKRTSSGQRGVAFAVTSR